MARLSPPDRHWRKARRRRSAARSPPTGRARWRASWSAPKKPGSTITVTVVSDASGAYAFPAGRLEPGNYKLTVRASGYALDGAGTVELAAGKTATADLKLKPARWNSSN